MSTTETTSSRTPTHIAYQVRKSKGQDKGFWTRIGAAWAHADGNGVNLQLDAFPVDGQITLRVAADKKD